MRSPSLLEFVKAKGKEYSISDVYIYDGGDRMYYDDGYLGNKLSFLDLLGTIAARCSDDEKFAMDIVKRAAFEMGCPEVVRDKRLSDDEYEKLQETIDWGKEVELLNEGDEEWQKMNKKFNKIMEDMEKNKK